MSRLGWLERLLGWCGCQDPREVVADLSEELEARRRSSQAPAIRVVWSAWQLAAIIAFESRDRVWPRIGRRARRPHGGRGPTPQAEAARRGGSLRPAMALRGAVASLRARPATPLLAAATLAIGFGAAAAVLSVFVGFFRDLPVPEGHRIVQVRIVQRTGGRSAVQAEVEAWSEGNRTFEAIGAFTARAFVVGGGERPPLRVTGAVMDPEVFELLRVPPMAGALPTRSQENGVGASPDAVVLGYELWRRDFGGDGDIVGSTVRLDGRVRIVAAVMPAGYEFPFNSDLWVLPDRAGEGRSSETIGLEVVGRLAAGISRDRAAGDLESILRARDEALGAGDLEARVLVDGFTEQRGEGGEMAALTAVLILVIALVLVSCSNVSNLLLHRAVARSRELAMHTALGASPSQVALQMMCEALAIALLGASFGLLVALGAVEYIESTLSDHWGYYWMRVAVDAQVVGLTLAFAVVTALAAGCLPAVRAGRADLLEPLKRESSSVGAGLGRVARLMLACQVSFSLSALLVAILMALGLLGTNHVEAGFPADSVYVASVSIDAERYGDPVSAQRFRRALTTGLSGRSSGGRAALSSGLIGVNAQRGVLAIEGRSAETATARHTESLTAVTPAFFELYGLETLRGRSLSDGDSGPQGAVAVVNGAFAARHFRDDDPIGARISVGVGDDPRWLSIVGVVSDAVIYASEETSERHWVYVPFEQAPASSFYVNFSGVSTEASASAVLRQVVLELDPDLPVGGVFGSDGAVSVAAVLQYVRQLYETVGTLAILGSFAAVLVSLIGLYGILSFEVGSSIAEIGIRMALGAPRSAVVLGVARKALAWLGPGLALGFGFMWVVGPLFGVFLFGARARDPRVFGGALIGYLLAAVLAMAPAARLAAAVDPGRVLKAD